MFYLNINKGRLVWSIKSSYKNVAITLIALCIILFSWMFDIVDVSLDNLDIAYKEMKSFLMRIGEVDINNMPKKLYILAFKIRYLVILYFYLIGFVITFVFTNWKLFLYTILVYIFVKCLLTDFFTKHFKFNQSWNINYKDIWKQRRNVISFIVKSWLMMLPIRFIIRGTIIVLFNFHDNFISDIFIVLLALPFYYYFSNIIRKYLRASLHGLQRTDTFSTVKPAESSIAMVSLRLENDYYLFNHYVIKQMNLYNMIYILFTIWIIQNYFYYCLIFMIIIFVIIMDIVLYRYIFPAKQQAGSYPYSSNQNKAASQQKKELLAAGPPILTLTLASLMYNLGAYLSWSALEGYNRPEGLQDPERGIAFETLKATEGYGPCLIKQVAASKFNTYKQVNPTVECFNWFHDNAMEDVNTSLWPRESDMAIAQIANSPILRMVYAQQEVVKRHTLFKRDVGDLSYKQLVTFKNDRFIGSVARVQNTLVINFIELNKLPPTKKYFMPTHIVQDESLRHINCELEPVKWAIGFFEEKYGIIIPFKKEIVSIITTTEMKPFGNSPSLVKVFRPYYLFSDLTTMCESEESYYLSKKEDDKWGPSVDELSKKVKVVNLKHNAINRKSTVEFIKRNDDRLKQLYTEYLETRPKSFRSKFPNMVVNIEDKDPDFNLERGCMFKKCTSEDLKSVVFFKQDELPIFFNFKKYTLIDMTWTRRRLVDKIEKMEPHTSYYGICANNVSVELISVENNTEFSIVNDSPEIYSILEERNTYKGGPYITDAIPLPKQTFNILDQKDGQTLEKFLKHPFE
jgi:predicted Zn-dependent protease with MMP-like domain